MFAQVDAGDYLGYGTHLPYCARNPLDSECRSESSEDDKAEDDDEPWLNPEWWGFEYGPHGFT